MSLYTEEEAIEHLITSLAMLETLGPRTRLDVLEKEGGLPLIQLPYDSVLLTRLNDYFEWRAGNRHENAGELMEEIALLLFKSFRGVQNIRGFQSYAAQHDLVVDSSSLSWDLLMTYLHLPRDGRTIVIEAKNQDQKITDQQFSRLCGILQNKFTNIGHLGVFVSRTPASGFPEPSGNESTIRERSLRNARATQALFHAKSNKFVVVIDENDFRMIQEGIPLAKLLEAKIREVEASSGLAISFDNDWLEIDLPSHLRKYFTEPDTQE